MSADNWEVCPRCFHEAGEGAHREQYRTLREDYEFYGADKGRVTADYRGECRSCGLKCSFSYGYVFWNAPEGRGAS